MVCRLYRPASPAPRRSGRFSTTAPQNSPAYWTAATSAITAFRRCGDLHAGFTHFHCPDCDHEFLLVFTCQQRGLCTSCHRRRTLIEGALIAGTICAPVPHRHLVLTEPRLIRELFRGDRSLLGHFDHAAHCALIA